MASDRRAMTVRLVSLGSREAAEAPAPLSAADRLRLTFELSAMSWSVADGSVTHPAREALRCVLRPLRPTAREGA